MLKLIQYYNADDEDEQCLFDLTNNKIMLKGDYYHDKISEEIEGYLCALKDFNIEFELEESELVYTNSSLFKTLGFCSDNM